MTGAEAAALLQAVGIDPRRRPETLSLQEFVAVAGRLETTVLERSLTGRPRQP
jgi:16S rRNA A1518/A1519 N6-dimethyltransferase RsmA/KsgA/DIM1 with predicted DNA glycosylase/AP lyase activity